MYATPVTKTRLCDMSLAVSGPRCQRLSVWLMIRRLAFVEDTLVKVAAALADQFKVPSINLLTYLRSSV